VIENNLKCVQNSKIKESKMAYKILAKEREQNASKTCAHTEELYINDP
jgi:hypothetical protein